MRLTFDNWSLSWSGPIGPVELSADKRGGRLVLADETHVAGELSWSRIASWPETKSWLDRNTRARQARFGNALEDPEGRWRGWRDQESGQATLVYASRDAATWWEWVAFAEGDKRPFRLQERVSEAIAGRRLFGWNGFRFSVGESAVLEHFVNRPGRREWRFQDGKQTIRVVDDRMAGFWLKGSLEDLGKTFPPRQARLLSRPESSGMAACGGWRSGPLWNRRYHFWWMRRRDRDDGGLELVEQDGSSEREASRMPCRFQRSGPVAPSSSEPVCAPAGNQQGAWARGLEIQLWKHPQTIQEEGGRHLVLTLPRNRVSVLKRILAPWAPEQYRFSCEPLAAVCWKSLHPGMTHAEWAREIARICRLEFHEARQLTAHQIREFGRRGLLLFAEPGREGGGA